LERTSRSEQDGHVVLGSKDDLMIVIGAVGFNGSGKDALIKYLQEEHGLPMFSMGDLVRAMAAKRGMRPTRSNLHEISQQVMGRYGEDVFAKKLIARIEKGSWDAVGVTGIRTPVDVRAFREHFGGDFVLVYVRVRDPRTRFERVQQRDETRDPESYARFLRQDQGEEELFHLEEAIQQADITIDNDGALEAFHRKIEKQVIGPILEHEEWT
jgi:dephospho-CoA kinase